MKKNCERRRRVKLLKGMFLVFSVACISIIAAIISQAVNKESETSVVYSPVSEIQLIDHRDTRINSLTFANEYLRKENDRLQERVVELEMQLSITEPETPAYSFSEEEITLLAKCVQSEAGHFKNHSNSQRITCSVILNRLASPDFPDTIHDVIYDKKNGTQFAVAYNGMLDREVVTEETMNNVLSVLENGGDDVPEDVLYFFSDSVEGKWVNTLPVYGVIEGTVFAHSKD